MFLDEREIVVRGGDGGDGIVAWKREKFMPHGGPGGGDGGHGGHLLFRADVQLTTFADMEQGRVFRAPSGKRGGGNCRHGASGEDRVVLVPVGTTVYDAGDGTRLVDLVEDGQVWRAARGGRGGRGNAAFATALDQRPQRADEGQPGLERRLRLELRLLADVGIVGLPNAGKSTLLTAISAATPRIGAYPFTTLEPVLGIVTGPEGTAGAPERFVVADLPGLIEGAHRGRGLGDRFLRHVERTRVLLHLVDAFSPEGRDPLEAWRTVRAEIAAYGRGLADRPEVLAVTKVDLAPSPEARAAVLRRIASGVDRGPATGQIHPVSAHTGEGISDLVRALGAALAAAPPAPEVPDRLPPVEDQSPNDPRHPQPLPGDGEGAGLRPDPPHGPPPGDPRGGEDPLPG